MYFRNLKLVLLVIRRYLKRYSKLDRPCVAQFLNVVV
jgi:hypothetical protein